MMDEIRQQCTIPPEVAAAAGLATPVLGVRRPPKPLRAVAIANEIHEGEFDAGAALSTLAAPATAANAAMPGAFVASADTHEETRTIGKRPSETLHAGTHAAMAPVDGFWRRAAAVLGDSLLLGGKAMAVKFFSAADADRDVALTRPEFSALAAALLVQTETHSSVAAPRVVEAAFADADAPPPDGKVTLGEFLESAERARLRERHYEAEGVH
jgi:hypothetical protein